MSDLAKWLRDLPAALRLDSTKLNDDISRESVSMFLHYYQCINMTARPLLFYVVQKHLRKQVKVHMALDWRNELSPTTIAVIEACITAARESTTIVAAAAKQNLIGTWEVMP
jgi:proline utilization trans-activator